MKDRVFGTYRLLTAVLLIAAGILLPSCSTKKNTFVRRSYHNLTSHYNVWWNGDQSVKAGDQLLSSRVKDDYSNVLRLFNYGKREDGLALNESMDRAIQKGAVCVQKHSMKFNSREQVKWIDDSYLMMGIGHFYKHDYIAAKRTFNFVASQYDYNNIKYTAELWLAKTYIETEEYTKAEAVLQSLMVKMAETDNLPKYFVRNFDYVMADYYIATKRYGNALPHLYSGMSMSKDRNLNTKALFIAGQILYFQNNLEQASDVFRRVIKRNPHYELAFESKLYMAKSYEATTGNHAQIMRMFDKMLKDSKNEEYIDRIYFAMADVELKSGNRRQGKEYLKKSVAKATTDRRQQAASSLLLANLLFDDSEYVVSQAYYDTAVSAIDNTYPGYDSLMNRSAVLTDLVSNLVVVQTQDSLLMLAKLDSTSRNAIIDKVIENYVAEQERLRKEEEIKELNELMKDANPDAKMPETTPTRSTVEWYFYNETALTQGSSAFLKKWGRRQLADNWRISDKQSLSFVDGSSDVAQADKDDEAEGQEEGDDKAEAKTYGPTDRGYYMNDIPFSEEKQALADSSIAVALYNIGLIYMDKLDDYPRSLEAFGELDRRYPGNSNEVKSWFAMHRIYEKMSDQTKSDKYKYRIVDKYPDTDYAKVILDPEYFAKKEKADNALAEFYEQTYSNYLSGNWRKVKNSVAQAHALYPTDTVFMSKFDFMNAMARGKTEPVDTLGAELYRLVKKYPDSEVRPRAIDMLQVLNEKYDLNIDLTDLVETDKEPEKVYPYTYNPNSQHFVIVIADSKVLRLEPLKVRISDFNKKQFRTKKFVVKSMMFENRKNLISIGNFTDETEANEYVTSMFLSDYLFGGVDAESYMVMSISAENYPIFYKNKNIDEYKEFINLYTTKNAKIHRQKH